MIPPSRRCIVAAVSIPTFLALSLLVLAGCGSSAAAATTSTACPTRTATNPAQILTGTIKALQPTGVTISTTTGLQSLTFTTKTRFTVLKTVAAATLAIGGAVQVYAGSANASGGTDAQRILVTTGTTGTTGFGPGMGMPTAGNGNRPSRGGFNPACRSMATPVAATFRGVRGTIVSLNLDLHTITVMETRGGTYSFTLTTATVIGSQSTGTVAQLKVGDTLSVTGTKTSTGLQALIVQDQTGH